MNGYGNFLYVVDFSFGAGVLPLFVETRRWCREQFGDSVELDVWEQYPNLRNLKWAWERGTFNKMYRCRIFFATEKEAEWFTLRWS